MTCTTVSEITPCEGGTGIIKFFCYDENDTITIPGTIFWQLSDKYGNIINSQSFLLNDITGTQESITISGTTGLGFVVTLYGDDLEFQSTSDDGVRYFAIKGTYDSTAGTDLPLRGELKFEIQNLINF